MRSHQIAEANNFNCWFESGWDDLMEMTETAKLAEEVRKRYDVSFDPERSTFHHSVLEFYSEAGFITDKQLRRLKKPLFPTRGRGSSIKQLFNDQSEIGDFEQQYCHDFQNAFLY